MTSSRKLGTSDVSVFPITFGAWAIGGWMWGGNEEADSIDAIRASLDAGINTIDTAAIYGMGHSETLVAKAIKGRPRDSVVIATKCGMRWNTDEGSDPWKTQDNDGKPVTVMKNAKPASIAYELEQSLERLQTDYIDLYQLHWPDKSTPIEESMAELEKHRKSGKIRAIGLSNHSVELMERAGKVGQLASEQPPYSLLTRKIEQDVLPWCRDHKVGIVCYSPMERGLLTGKVGPDRKFDQGDHRATHKYFTPAHRQLVLDALRQLDPLRDKYNATYAQLVISWTMHVPGITAALVGARDAEQAKQNAHALTLQLSAEEHQQIRRAFDDAATTLNA